MTGSAHSAASGHARQPGAVFGASIGARQVIDSRGPAALANAPATWRAAEAAARSIGDVRALEATRVPQLDYLCAGGRMYAQAGVFFCRFD